MKHVAVVDDDKLLRGYYIDAFKVRGYEAIAYDCPSEIHPAALEVFDLIVVDLTHHIHEAC